MNKIESIGISSPPVPPPQSQPPTSFWGNRKVQVLAGVVATVVIATVAAVGHLAIIALAVAAAAAIAFIAIAKAYEYFKSQNTPALSDHSIANKSALQSAIEVKEEKAAGSVFIPKNLKDHELDRNATINFPDGRTIKIPHQTTIDVQRLAKYIVIKTPESVSENVEKKTIEIDENEPVQIMYKNIYDLVQDEHLAEKILSHISQNIPNAGWKDVFENYGHARRFAPNKDLELDPNLFKLQITIYKDDNEFKMKTEDGFVTIDYDSYDPESGEKAAGFVQVTTIVNFNTDEVITELKPDEKNITRQILKQSLKEEIKEEIKNTQKICAKILECTETTEETRKLGKKFNEIIQKNCSFKNQFDIDKVSKEQLQMLEKKILIENKIDIDKLSAKERIALHKKYNIINISKICGIPSKEIDKLKNKFNKTHLSSIDINALSFEEMEKFQKELKSIQKIITKKFGQKAEAHEKMLASITEEMRQRLIDRMEGQLKLIGTTDKLLTKNLNQKIEEYKNLSPQMVKKEFQSEFADQFVLFDLMEFANRCPKTFADPKTIKREWTRQLDFALSHYKAVQSALANHKGQLKLLDHLKPEYIQKKISEIQEKINTIGRLSEKKISKYLKKDLKTIKIRKNLKIKSNLIKLNVG